MIIGLAAADGTLLCQAKQLRAGFQDLGHAVVEYDDPLADFVFVGNPTYEPYIDVCRRKPTIFNVLDLARHCPEHLDIVSRLKDQLPHAGAVTCISDTVRGQLKDLCSVNAHVIYYPTKPVTNVRARKYPQFKVAMVGRTSDPNKRCGAAVLALTRAGFDESEVAIVGPEYPGWGTRVGTVSDETLNDIYGSVDYVMMLSKEEGLGLTAAEGTCAGAIPIVLPDLSTYAEFWAASPMHPFYQSLKSIDQLASLLIYLKSDPDTRETLRAQMTDYGNTVLRPLFAAPNVAARIIDVYHSIKR